MPKYVYNPFTNNLDAVSIANPAGNALDFLTGNAGAQVSPDAGNNVFLVGDNTTGITTTGNISPNTLTIEGIASSTTQVGTTRYATNAEAAAQTIGTAALTPANITSFFSINPLPPTQGGAKTIVGTANQIAVVSAPTTDTLSFPVTGISIGTYQATTPPVGGMLVPGQVAIGTTVLGPPINQAKLTIDSTPNNKAILLTGTFTSLDSSNNNVGIALQNIYSSPGSGGFLAQISSTPQFFLPVGATATWCVSVFGASAFDFNSGTIDNAAIFYANTGIPSSGTLTNAYGAYINNPGFGFNQIALYTDDISIGTPGIVAPATGAFITGQVGIGSLPPDTRPQLYVQSNTPYGIWNTGVRTINDTSGNQLSTFSNTIFSPGTGSNSSAEFSANPTFDIPFGQTVNIASCFFGSNRFPGNAGTVNTSAIFYASGGVLPAAGTITNAYGAYFNTPTYGDNAIGCYSDSITIGSPGVVPPATGARILGNILNDALTPSEVVGTDASKNLVSIPSSTAGFVLTSNGAAAPTFQAPAAGSQQGAARYVVTPSLLIGGGYTSIQAAINQAVTDGANSANPATVWIWAGNYTENVALASFVHLAAAAVGSDSVTIIGNTTYTAGASQDVISLNNINFQTPLAAGAAFSVLGANTCDVFIENCFFLGSTDTAFLLNNINCSVRTDGCIFNANSGFKCFDIISNALFVMFGGDVNSSDTPSTLTGTGVFAAIATPIQDSFLITGAVILEFLNCNMNSLGTFECLNLSISNLAVIELCSVSCSAASGFWVTGAGVIAANAVAVGTSSANEIDPALNIVGLPLQIGQLSSSPSDSNTVTATFGTTLTIGTPVLNSSLYNILVNISVAVSSATAATIVLGVGRLSFATNTVVDTFTVATPTVYNFSAYVPSNYNLTVDTTGTITVTSVTLQSMGI